MTLLMVMLAVNFTACSDDEEEQTIIDQANLIGKWQSTWAVSYTHLFPII